ncbi:hypothetical protein, partial [Nitrosomonas sp.]|uniref:hypothetical protein n=1 Tax=Nitrosomonas sp. TaxID=42353 RepID=UPI001D375D26
GSCSRQVYEECKTGGFSPAATRRSGLVCRAVGKHEVRVGGAGRVRTAASQFCSLPEGSTTDDDQQRRTEKTG